MTNFSEIANHIWNVADLLRGSFKQHEYESVILPFTVLKRFDSILKPYKEEILKLHEMGTNIKIIQNKIGLKFYNTSKFDFNKLLDDSNSIETNLRDYINGYSEEIKDILDNFEFHAMIERLQKAKLLFLVVEKFSEINLNKETADNLTMGYAFEELIRRFAEASNETAGEHFTPREIIELMVEVLIGEDNTIINSNGRIIPILDPACGTGGMLALAQDKLLSMNSSLAILPHGQELNPRTYAISKSDMLIKDNDNPQIKLGNSFDNDAFKEKTFTYMLANPPFGVEWKQVEKFIKDEHKNLGFNGRFGAGTPRISDGSLLFLQHMISKMDAEGSRIAIIFNGSPLFTGSAESGESNIRKYIIENDMLEGIIALPDQLFFNTGIPTYIWVVTNKKQARRKGKIRLVNGTQYFSKLRKSLNNKRKEINEESRSMITNLYSMHETHKDYKEFNNKDFGYTSVTIERPLYNDKGEIIKDSKGNPKADSKLRDTENIPLTMDIEEYFKTEVLPHVPDAWMDRAKDKIGYEIPFTRHFYEFKSLRPSEEIKQEIKGLESRIVRGLEELLKND